MYRQELEYILSLPKGDELDKHVDDNIFPSPRHHYYSQDIRDAWSVQLWMTLHGWRFIISRSHHRPKELPTWRASFCKHHGKSNRWFDEDECIAICKAAIIAVYNDQQPVEHIVRRDRYVQQVGIVGREAEV